MLTAYQLQKRIGDRTNKAKARYAFIAQEVEASNLSPAAKTFITSMLRIAENRITEPTTSAWSIAGDVIKEWEAEQEKVPHDQNYQNRHGSI